MRDPDAEVFLRDGKIFREIHRQSQSIDILRSALAKELVEREWLIAYWWESATQIYSPRIPIVVCPSEWSDSHFVDAAQLTLAISNRSLVDKVELKDASAYNVLFHGCAPIFCDHTSFQRQATWHWFAFGQFVRNFILPLAIANLTRLHAKDCFILFRDGIQPEQARTILGARRFLSRWWPLTLSLGRFGNPKIEKNIGGMEIRGSIYEYCQWNIRPRRRIADSPWVSYTQDRRHYPVQAEATKIGQVRDWLERVRPNWVIDLGCNTGEFTSLSLDVGASVVAIDQDHDVIDGLYRRNKGKRNLYPLISNLTDPTPGRGWNNRESLPLLERLAGFGDVVLCLALIHHLIVSESIPVEEVAKQVSVMTKEYSIVEFIGVEDPMMKLLISRHGRDPSEFEVEKQKIAFLQYFYVEEIQTLPASNRELALLRKRSQA